MVRKFDQAQPRLIQQATTIVAQEFFQPTCARLFRLLDHGEPGVRLYAIILLTGLVVENLPAFNTEALANVAYRLKTQSENDTDERARSCAATQLQELLEAALEGS